MRLFRKWYIPGWFSLILLPPLFIHYATKASQAKTIHSVSVVFPEMLSQHDEKRHIYLSDTLAEFSMANYPPPRHYLRIIINNNYWQNNFNVLHALTQLQRMIHKKDILSGLKFEFTKEASYGRFMEVFDLLRLMNIGYIIDGNNIWAIFVPPRPRSADDLLTGCYLSRDVIRIPDPPVKRTISAMFRRGLELTRKQGKVIFSVFIVCCALIIWLKRSGNAYLFSGTTATGQKIFI